MNRSTGSPRRAAVAFAAALALVVAPLGAHTATAGGDPTTDRARQHFQKGRQLFDAGDYREAMAAFAAADKLAPAPLLEFNIALCHERLGERAEAVRRYRLYLERVPDAANRDAVDAKIRRLESELEAEADARRRPVPLPAPGGVPPVGPAPPAGVEAGPPASPAPSARTGDPELDRVAAIDIARVRAERSGGATSAGSGAAASPESGAPPPVADNDGGQSAKTESTPIYKKWWFWAIAVVGVLIVVDIAASGSDENGERALVRPLGGDPTRNADPAGGAVLLRF